MEVADMHAIVTYSAVAGLYGAVGAGGVVLHNGFMRIHAMGVRLFVFSVRYE